MPEPKMEVEPNSKNVDGNFNETKPQSHHTVDNESQLIKARLSDSVQSEKMSGTSDSSHTSTPSSIAKDVVDVLMLNVELNIAEDHNSTSLPKTDSNFQEVVTDSERADLAPSQLQSIGDAVGIVTSADKFPEVESQPIGKPPITTQVELAENTQTGSMEESGLADVTLVESTENATATHFFDASDVGATSTHSFNASDVGSTLESSTDNATRQILTPEENDLLQAGLQAAGGDAATAETDGDVPRSDPNGVNKARHADNVDDKSAEDSETFEIQHISTNRDTESTVKLNGKGSLVGNNVESHHVWDHVEELSKHSKQVNGFDEDSDHSEQVNKSPNHSQQVEQDHSGQMNDVVAKLHNRENIELSPSNVDHSSHQYSRPSFDAPSKQPINSTTYDDSDDNSEMIEVSFDEEPPPPPPADPLVRRSPDLTWSTTLKMPNRAPPPTPMFTDNQHMNVSKSTSFVAEMQAQFQSIREQDRDSQRTSKVNDKRDTVSTSGFEMQSEPHFQANQSTLVPIGTAINELFDVHGTEVALDSSQSSSVAMFSDPLPGNSVFHTDYVAIGDDDDEMALPSRYPTTMQTRKSEREALLEEKVAQLEEDIRDATSMVNDLSAENQNLLDAMKALKAENLKLSALIDEKTEYSDKLDDELHTTTSRNQNLEQTIDVLKQTVSEKEVELDNIRDQMKELSDQFRNQYDELTSQLEASKEEQGKLDVRSSEAMLRSERKIEKLTFALEESKKELERSNTRLRQLDNENNALSRKLRVANETRNSYMTNSNQHSNQESGGGAPVELLNELNELKRVAQQNMLKADEWMTTSQKLERDCKDSMALVNEQKDTIEDLKRALSIAHDSMRELSQDRQRLLVSKSSLLSGNRAIPAHDPNNNNQRVAELSVDVSSEQDDSSAAPSDGQSIARLQENIQQLGMQLAAVKQELAQGNKTNPTFQSDNHQSTKSDQLEMLPATRGDRRKSGKSGQLELLQGMRDDFAAAQARAQGPSRRSERALSPRGRYQHSPNRQQGFVPTSPQHRMGSPRQLVPQATWEDGGVRQATRGAPPSILPQPAAGKRVPREDIGVNGLFRSEDQKQVGTVDERERTKVLHEEQRRREASAPFATQASLKDMEGVAKLESFLLKINLEREGTISALNHLRERGARTMDARNEMHRLETKFAQLDKQAGSIRLKLRMLREQ